MKQICAYNKRNVNLYAINVILKRENILNTKNLLFKRKIVIAYFVKIANL